jgi:hypothetical protein
VSRKDSRTKDLRLAILRIEKGRASKVPKNARLSISSVAVEAGIAPSTIHTRYPDIAELIREKIGKGVRTQRDRKASALMYTRARLRVCRSELASQRALLASVTSKLFTALADLQRYRDSHESNTGRVVPLPQPSGQK